MNQDPGAFSRGTCSVAAPRVSEHCNYYEINGSCESDLRNQMRKKGPSWSDGRHYDSLTSWKLTWRYAYEQSGGSCSASDFRVDVDVVFQYPRWGNQEGAAPVLLEKWSAYLQHLAMHEQGHRDLAVEAAEDIARSVAMLPPRPRCRDLDERVNELCRVRLKKLDQQETAYDASTRHGAEQGALFP